MKEKLQRLSLLLLLAMVGLFAKAERVLYSWDAGTETGGVINQATSNAYLTISGKSDYSSGTTTLTLKEAVHGGDIISVTAYRNKDVAGKASGFKAKFDKGGEVASEKGTEFVNINEAVSGTEEYGTEPNTCTFTIPAEAEGSKTITITRSHTSTNLFITKLVITTTKAFDPNAIETPVITPASGTYASEQEVTIACGTEEAIIYYTTDGSNPSATSTEYTQAFIVSETTTIKAIAIKGDYSSDIAESVITIATAVEPGQSNLEWDYTETAPTENPDNGLYYDQNVNDAAGTNNGLKGIKLNSSGYAYFAKNPVAGKLTLTIGKRSGTDPYEVNVYSCTITDGQATKGDLIGTVAVAESPGSGSIEIPADVTGIYIERKTGSEGVLSKIVFKENVARTFTDFEIPYATMQAAGYTGADLPADVTFSGSFHDIQHGYENATISVPTDGGAVKFTISGCTYGNSFAVKNANGETLTTLDQKSVGCYDAGGKLTYFYTGDATTLTFGPIGYLAYFKAEAVDVEEVTITYKDQDGNELGTKTVLEGETLGEIPYTEADLTIPEGYKFRGWTYTNGVKVKDTDIVDGNKSVVASVTAIETVTMGSIQNYNLTSNIFYPEDHETFSVTDGAWHDAQHGFIFSADGSFSVDVAGKAQIVLGLCRYSGEGTFTVTDANGNVVKNDLASKSTTPNSCATTSFNYDGEATTLTFTCSATTYVHNVTVYNVEQFVEKDAETGYYMPADGAGLVLALNAASTEDGATIFLKNGTYDLGETVLTAISGNNISIIGESMEGTIIKNMPPLAVEGLKTSATLHNTSTNLYMQDITIQNALDYYNAGSAGRGIAFWDEGKHTIAKNVKLLSYQDTYLSTVNQQFYWEDSEIHGCVDFICGGSDVFFENTKLVCESRKKDAKSGEATITAPQPGTQEKYGYVFNNCTIDNKAASFNLGRAWGGNSGNGPKQAYLNTTLLQPTEIIATRFIAAGMNEAAKSFKEYHSMDDEGNVVSPASNIVNFTHSTGSYQYETILTDAEAANFTLDKVFTDWTPASYTEQLKAADPKLENGKISWEAVDGATMYAIMKNGSIIDFTQKTEYTIETASNAKAPAGDQSGNDTYAVRVANIRGGFGEAVEVTEIASGINEVNTEDNTQKTTDLFNLAGQKVNKSFKGIVIMNGKKVVK